MDKTEVFRILSLEYKVISILDCEKPSIIPQYLVYQGLLLQ